LGNAYPKAGTVTVEQAFINGVTCYWLTPAHAQPGETVIYLHGGAYAAGSIRSHAAMVSHIAESISMRILFVEYALAPENPYPAGLNDVMGVYEELAAIYPGDNFYFIGDSAGGGLTISAVAKMQEQGLPLPEKTVFISPWTDLACVNPSYAENKLKDVILNIDYVKNCAADYSGDTPLEISNPANITFSSFPPSLIVAGSNEILLDDSCNLYKSLKPIQPQTFLTIYENQNHVWPLANISTAAAQKALAETAAFLNCTGQHNLENTHLENANQ
jgi:monoterpene epsilon-lactone hydrolase